jgi:hypothetical protein
VEKMENGGIFSTGNSESENPWDPENHDAVNGQS